MMHKELTTSIFVKTCSVDLEKLLEESLTGDGGE